MGCCDSNTTKAKENRNNNINTNNKYIDNKEKFQNNNYNTNKNQNEINTNSAFNQNIYYKIQQQSQTTNNKNNGFNMNYDNNQFTTFNFNMNDNNSTSDMDEMANDFNEFMTNVMNSKNNGNNPNNTFFSNNFVFVDPNKGNNTNFMENNQNFSFQTRNFQSHNFPQPFTFKITRNGIIKNNQQEEEDLEKKIILDPNYHYTDFQKLSLERHNKYRREHHVDELQLSNELCEIAQKYADYLACKNLFEHSHSKFKGYNMGENLYSCSGFKPDGNRAVDSWYEEIEDYNFKSGKSKNGKPIGHLTQLLWKTSKYVGIGIGRNEDSYYVVANYFPSGNYIGTYTENVFPK